jgi:hypothetical protein
MKENWLSFSFSSFHKFFGTVSFQRVTGEKIKKYASLSTRASGCEQSAGASFARRSHAWISANDDI